MAKVQTRTEKYRAYREEIQKEEEKAPEIKVENKPQVLSPSNKPENTKTAQNKHTYNKKEQNEIAKEKTIYDIYVKKRMIKRAIYLIFVLLFVGILILILFLVSNEFLR